jgi:hypothetical protein
VIWLQLIFGLLGGIFKLIPPHDPERRDRKRRAQLVDRWWDLNARLERLLDRTGPTMSAPQNAKRLALRSEIAEAEQELKDLGVNVAELYGDFERR